MTPTSDSTLPISIRAAVPTDSGFLLTGFTRELHKTPPYNFIPNSIFFPAYTALFNQLVARSTVLVAHVEDSPDSLMGYIIAEPHETSVIVHWGMVKSVFWRMGVFRSLLEAVGWPDKTAVCSHFFKLFPLLRDRYGLIYDPTVLGDSHG